MLHCLFAELTLLKISQRMCSLWAPQQHVKILCCHFVDLQKFASPVSSFPLCGRHLLLWQFNARTVCQTLHCLLKCKIFILHHKGKYISTCSASKTVIHLFSRRHRKRRCLFVVKRTESKIRTSLFLKAHITGNNVYHIISGTHFFNQFIGIVSHSTFLHSVLLL